MPHRKGLWAWGSPPPGPTGSGARGRGGARAACTPAPPSGLPRGRPQWEGGGRGVQTTTSTEGGGLATSFHPTTRNSMGEGQASIVPAPKGWHRLASDPTVRLQKVGVGAEGVTQKNGVGVMGKWMGVKIGGGDLVARRGEPPPPPSQRGGVRSTIRAAAALLLLQLLLVLRLPEVLLPRGRPPPPPPPLPLPLPGALGVRVSCPPELAVAIRRLNGRKMDGMGVIGRWPLSGFLKDGAERPSIWNAASPLGGGGGDPVGRTLTE